MKRIVFISYFFEPDLSAGSFRNSSLVKVLAPLAAEQNCLVEVYTSTPNRYSSYQAEEALEYERKGSLIINRISTPQFGRGKFRVIMAFLAFFLKVLWMDRGKKAELVYATSSKLLSAYMGYIMAVRKKAPLYLDIRDLFALNMDEIIKSGSFKAILMPLLNHMERKAFSYATHINLISGGFLPLFRSYGQATVTEFTNGIDNMFLTEAGSGATPLIKDDVKTILYAGNIGEGQGLHKIIPQAAQMLGAGYRFLIYGDGGMRSLLEDGIASLGVQNVDIRKPVPRKELIAAYQASDFLFIHLNNYKAFEKVLPSKIFELSAFPKPMIAGVGGFPGQFIRSEIPHSFVFDPCDADAMVAGIHAYPVDEPIDRTAFVRKYTRDRINQAMAASILQYL